MKVTLKTDKFIRGYLTAAGTTVDISDEVAQVLIDCGCATKDSVKTKKINKAED
jgi:hypothetical protein